MLEERFEAFYGFVRDVLHEAAVLSVERVERVEAFLEDGFFEVLGVVVHVDFLPVELVEALGHLAEHFAEAGVVAEREDGLVLREGRLRCRGTGRRRCRT